MCPSVSLPLSEGEWVFSSDTGIRGLAEQSSYQRLVVVSMHRGHQYGDLQQVKKEVSDNALSMIQAGVPQNVKVGLSKCFHITCALMKLRRPFY